MTMTKGIFPKLFLIALALLYLIVFKNVPYFNLILQTKVIIGLIFVLITFLFSVKAETLFRAALFLLLPAFLLLLWQKNSPAKLIGELIYLLLILAFIKKFNDFRKLV